MEIRVRKRVYIMNFIFFLTPKEAFRKLFEDSDEITFFEDPFTIEDCVVAMGIFPSKSQARKNGWSGPIPRGFKEYKIGKRRFWTYWPLLWEDRFSQSSMMTSEQ